MQNLTSPFTENTNGSGRGNFRSSGQSEQRNNDAGDPFLLPRVMSTNLASQVCQKWHCVIDIKPWSNIELLFFKESEIPFICMASMLELSVAIWHLRHNESLRKLHVYELRCKSLRSRPRQLFLETKLSQKFLSKLHSLENFCQMTAMLIVNHHHFGPIGLTWTSCRSAVRSTSFHKIKTSVKSGS